MAPAYFSSFHRQSVCDDYAARMNADELIATFRNALTTYENSKRLFGQVDEWTAADPEQVIAWSEIVKKRKQVASHSVSFSGHIHGLSRLGGRRWRGTKD
jgi:hypothetical protein